MLKFQRKPWVISVLALCVLAALGHTAGATMSSTNYSVTSDSINLGGAYSSSSNYQVWDSIGELAAGDDLSSTNYQACAGMPCTGSESFITFTLTQGTSSPGTSGAGIAFGTLAPGTVETSNGSSINSIFLTLEAVAAGGVNVTVVSENSALARTGSPSTTIDSATADLSVASSGYGLCVESVTENGQSPTTLEASSPYNGSCDKTTNHNVGLVDGTSRTIVSTTGSVIGGSSEVLVKAKASSATPGGNDYADTLTFIATGTY